MEPDTRVDVIVAYDDGSCKIVTDIRYADVQKHIGYIPAVCEWVTKVVVTRREEG